MKNNKNDQLKFLILGGVNNIGRNCYVVEYGKDIVVVDLGFGFPEATEYGTNYLIPDVDYLKKRRDRIRGIVISHAHMDHIGALPFVLEDLGFPTIYGREFVIAFIKEKLKEFGLDKKARYRVIETKQDVVLNSITIRLANVTHTIPQSSAVFLKTPAGNVLYTGDYMFDDNPVNEPLSDYEELKRFGQLGVDLVGMDSTNVFEEGKTKSETEIAHVLDGIIAKAEGRIIAATFASLGTRIYSLIEIARKHKRRVVVTGWSMKTMISVLRSIGYIKVNEDIFLSEKDISKVPDNQILILATGTQGEEMSALSRMSRDEHANIKIKPTDTIVLSSSVVPGNDVPVQHLLKNLLRLGARVFHRKFMDVHSSGHGYKEDMKEMYNLVQPKNAIPVHGWPSQTHELGYLLNRWGMKKDNILTPDVGQMFVFDSRAGRWNKGKKIKCKTVYVEGVSVGETGQAVIEERSILASYGIVLIVMNLSKNFQLVREPVVVSRGFVYVKNNKSVLQMISKESRKVFKWWRNSEQNISKSDIKRLKDAVEKSVGRMIYKKTERKPVVVVEIVSHSA